MYTLKHTTDIYSKILQSSAKPIEAFDEYFRRSCKSLRPNRHAVVDDRNASLFTLISIQLL